MASTSNSSNTHTDVGRDSATADTHDRGNENPNTEYEHSTAFTATKAPVTSAQSFTPRSLAVGLIIGTLIIFSNTYFGLQTGWMSLMTMPSSLIGFAVFKSLSKHLSFPFTPVENVLIQTVAGAVGTMPLGCGFVGVIPALEYLLRDGADGPSGDGGIGEGGPLNVGFWKLVIWSLGVCLFGAIFAVPLRKEVIIREKLRFPSGTATALMIRMLHGGSRDEKTGETTEQTLTGEDRLLSRGSLPQERSATSNLGSIEPTKNDRRKDWKSKIRLLIGAFAVSAIYTLFSYFIPQIRDLPIFGLSLAQNWLWTLNPSPAYVGQGIIMGPSTSMHMLFGAVLGWAILSPIAKNKGWAPGPVGDWENGSKGWIIWVSLAIMLADSIINLGWLIARTLYESFPRLATKLQSLRQNGIKRRNSNFHSHIRYSTLHSSSEPAPMHENEDEDEKDDAPASELISSRTVAILLPVTLVLNVLCMHIAFGDIISPFLSTLATILAVLLSIMGVRALGETDLNPVSGISKLTQLIFSLATPASMHTRRSAVVTNLLAGAVSEAGALQAGDMMQDLKTGHLLGASPKAQFYGQVIGSLFGAVVSTAVYKMYVNVYPIPSDQFQIPTAFVWIFTARLVTGQGLPPMAWQAAIIFGIIFVVTTVLRIISTYKKPFNQSPPWLSFVPGGIAVAVGMFNVPSFTLARAIGGAIAWWWARRNRKEVHEDTSLSTNPIDPNPTSILAAGSATEEQHDGEEEGEGAEDHHPLIQRQKQHTPPPAVEDESSSTVVVLASGLILGEGVLSILNLILASMGVPHL
ncbi:putative oligopeptide transporter, OPT family [Talaromyces proteolyticus]|uniref:Oligopeptide transporter, OPT family n=1 Tax=Talaromyces proteolyticus TaxID=1131652 RepID=A0AAD4Q1K1_9EURO|nr:putative oligopeptide transporter, OPT family [Talaromyces proteolyticus]KAH8698565.1 putative oligopeptide transporter, OPT family [Talaromyces proteolyticus]